MAWSDAARAAAAEARRRNSLKTKYAYHGSSDKLLHGQKVIQPKPMQPGGFQQHAWFTTSRKKAGEYARITALETKGRPVIAVVKLKGLTKASTMKSDIKISTKPVRIHKLLRLK